MKPILKPKKPVPAGIVKLGAATKEPFALFIYLDSIPYCEVKATRLKDFSEKLFDWKRANLPSLRPPVSVRYFIRVTNNLSIQEARI